MRLRKLEWFALGVAILTVTEDGVYGFRKIPELQLAGMKLWLVLGLLVLIGAALAIGTWRRESLACGATQEEGLVVYFTARCQ